MLRSRALFGRLRAFFQIPPAPDSCVKSKFVELWGLSHFGVCSLLGLSHYEVCRQLWGLSPVMVFVASYGVCRQLWGLSRKGFVAVSEKLLTSLER